MGISSARAPWAFGLLLTALPACAVLEAPAADVTGEVLVGGDLLYYEITGQGEIPVVLIHGGGVDRRVWSEVSTTLEEDHLVVQYDRRGYGRSRGPSTVFSEVQDLRTLVEWIGVGPVHLVGCRSGASIALEFALEYPRAVRSLTLIATSGLGGHRYSGHATSGVDAVFKAARSRGAPAGIALWLEQPGMFADGDTEQAARQQMRALLEANAGVFDFPTQLRRWSTKTKQRLSQLDLPALVVWGAADTPDQREVARLLAEGIRGARAHRFENAGRMVVLELPERLGTVIADFITLAAGIELEGTL